MIQESVLRRSPRLQVRKENYGWRRDTQRLDNHGTNMVSYKSGVVSEVGETQYPPASSPGLMMLTDAIDAKDGFSDKDYTRTQSQELL